MISFKIIPVFGYEDVMAANDNFLQGQQLSEQVQIIYIYALILFYFFSFGL